MKRVYQLSRIEFLVAMIAFAGVLVFGILKGVLLAVIMSLVLLIRRIANPNVAVLGRIGNTNHYSDIERHPDNTTYKGILILRVEASILYFNDAHILEKINEKIEAYREDIKLVILDMSPSSYVDVAGSKMLLQLSNQLHKKNIKLKIVEALSTVREILRKQGMEEVIGHISRRISIHDVVEEFVNGKSNGAVQQSESD